MFHRQPSSNLKSLQPVRGEIFCELLNLDVLYLNQTSCLVKKKRLLWVKGAEAMETRFSSGQSSKNKKPEHKVFIDSNQFHLYIPYY
jgi:hypothetical protein